MNFELEQYNDPTVGGDCNMMHDYSDDTHDYSASYSNNEQGDLTKAAQARKKIEEYLVKKELRKFNQSDW